MPWRIRKPHGKMCIRDRVPRIVLIDADGLAFECVSVGMYSAIRKLVAIYGAPTWEPPLTVTVKQKSVGKGSMYTLQM